MKTILVTGSTDGIGLETARQLKALGHRVILHGRTQARLDAARKATGLEEGLLADFSNFDEVAAMAARAPDLDVLLNNAGVYLKQPSLNKQGIEMTLAVNHFAPMLLTLKLKAKLAGAEDPRVITVASGVHQGGSLDMKDFGLRGSYSPYGAYAGSKLANVLFAARLTHEPGFEKALCLSLHPGVIGTKMLREGFGMGGDSVESGAKTSVYCATAAGLEKYNGTYFNNSRPAPSQAAEDKKMQEALWEASCMVLKAWL
jgi:NAD(P)-dependent dehydrogenase (short-subunit alcohol dehydrogenase family)